MPRSAANCASSEDDGTAAAAPGGGGDASARGEAQGGEKAQVQVIARAAAVLRALEGQPGGLSLGQIAQGVGLPRSTVQRIVGALGAEGFLIGVSPASKVRLGPALLRLGASVESNSVGLAKPIIAQLSNELGETVDLAAVKGRSVVFVDQVVGQRRLRAVSAVGESFPLYCTANGKAYLAQLTDGQVAELIGHRYKRRTPHTLTTLDALLADLQQARRDGIAFDREEHTLGICAAGVLVRDLLGNVLAVSVPVPSARYRDSQHLIAQRLLAAKAALEKQLGH